MDKLLPPPTDLAERPNDRTARNEFVPDHVFADTPPMDFFIGVTPPDDIQQRIVRLQTAFACKRIVEPHITIKAQSGLTVDRAWLKPVENFLRQQTPFRVALTGLLTVPNWFWFPRIYQQASPDEPYTTLLDVPFHE